MTKLSILSFLLLSNIALSKQTFQEAQDLLLAELSTTKELIRKEELAWEGKFHQFLIENENPNIKLIGYYEILSRLREIKNNVDLISISSEINSMVFLETLSHKSIATIAAICSYQQLKPLCDHDAILKRQNLTMPDNAYIFINGLNLAYEVGDQDEIKNAINNMAQSTHIDHFMYSDERFRSQLENYVKDNPIPKNTLAMGQLSINEFSRPKSNELNRLSDFMEDTMIFYLVIGNKLTQPIPSYRDLVDVCKNNLTLEKSCFKIAELFIHKSKTIITTLIGHAIKVEIFKQQGDIENLELAESIEKNFKKNYECLAGIMQYGSTYTSFKGFEFSKIADPIEREFGEMAFIESLAQLNYEYYKELGDDNITNPKTCNHEIIK